MSQQAQPPPVANGVLTAARVGGNRKKQKRRAKLAARQNEPEAEVTQVSAGGSAVNGRPSQAPYSPPASDYNPGAYPGEAYEEPYDYSSDEDDDPLTYDRQYQHSLDQDTQNPLSKNKRKKRKNKAQVGPLHPSDHHGRMGMPPPLPNMAMQRGNKGVKQNSIWNTSTQEERERIKEFWLSLSEDDRKGLLKIEKNAVLSKMKEQQKHSCSCTVCGRKRVAIEEELEVLYDAYYEELAQYANRPEDLGETVLSGIRPPLPHAPAHALPSRPLNTGQLSHHRTSRVQEIIDEDDDQPYSDEDDEEIYSDEEELYSDDEDYEDDLPPGIGSGFFDFGQNLQVKDGILTVADDLLKNDGRKFIEMMEQLAERRMQREQEVQYAAHQPKHHDESPLDDEDEYDDEDDYDSQDEYDDEEEEEDERGGMTEEQRMEEGRRMFQIFAARMFEQRVLTAYREKVAAERQARLLEELEEEDKAKNQKDAQKAKNAEKKKNKKQAQKQAKQEEKAKKEAEEKAKKEAEEEAERQKQEEQRKKREELKRKKDEQKRAQDEERARKEAERQKRLNEDRERQLEADRKVREQKAAEKRLRDENKKKERERREVEEKGLREQKAWEDKRKREQDSKDKSEQESRSKEKTAPQPSQILKRPSQPSQVAVPPALVQQKSTSGVSSPHIPVATPVIPKTAMPGVRARGSSELESRTSPKGTVAPSAQHKSKSPVVDLDSQQIPPKTILQNPNKQRPAVSMPQPASHQRPPPGDHPAPFQGGFGSMGFPPFGGHAAPGHQRLGPPFQQQGPPGGAFRGFPPGPAPPPGVNGFPAMSQGRGFAGDAPPGFQNQVPGLGSHAAPGMGAPRAAGSHSRHPSTSGDHDMSPPAHAQPISRPAPIQRPSSVMPSSEHEFGEIADDMSKHLGSRALLDDADEPLPPAAELRRTSNPIGAPRPHIGFNPPMFSGQPSAGFGSGPPGNNWPSPSPGAFGPPGSGLSTPNWGGSLSGPIGGPSWPNTAFGSLPTSSGLVGVGGGGVGGPRPSNANRPRAVRIAVCNACRHLSPSGQAEYHDVSVLLQQIGREGSLDVAPSFNEIEEICETEGDAHNGGGLLHVRHSGPNFAVRFEQDNPLSGSGRGAALGEIGSPVPSHSVPFGQHQQQQQHNQQRPFGSMGGLASPGGF